MFRKRDTHIHFVGIGGIGMSGIAEVLVNLGYRVTGTDLADTEITRRLVGFGATIHRGHGDQYLGDADVVVISSAIRPDNPEVVAARARKIPVIPRAEMLGELMRLKQGLLVAGSHGKTTTTSMVAAVLHEAGLDPTVVIGGKVNGFDSNARLGYGEVFVAEADESDGSFLVLSPTHAIITNIDAEHLDHYGSLDRLLDAFVGFANRVPFYGMAAICVDDPNVRAVASRMVKRTVSYGIDSEDADYRATQLRAAGGHSYFRVLAHGEDRGEFELSMPGRHNVLNALAAIALCDEQGVSTAVSRKALREFAGVQRRFTWRGEVDGVAVIDDYGHHPTELRATLAAARDAYPERRLVAVFQPHRYSRVRDHLEDFAASLDAAELVVFTPIYPAGERPIEGISSARLAELARARRPGREVLVVEAGDADALIPATCELLRASCRAGDLVLTLGAGSITRVSHALVEGRGV
ncbi:UDP-N-acetylmuramate--L-alanine ligase [Pseudenhygromyxa sp. WMMC2535]|uniref:UDP-N-acetylmuramate--L-alanine ligase n=1 Tax=Pseudenhygromyxa sp. WMMC2535 TaxID=2712867 RepID=UPI0015543F16|nr:UDP-N-acetylmuramate--L-alanine ligase [Pseudenhygromyxa sp. WMMC2535]NVB36897.1 UDP-N-acetylmuramate--L-alanine ligase [Pseudenhygromyxa sp. WMMC2535]